MSWKQFFVWIILFGTVQVGANMLLPVVWAPRYEYRTEYLSTRSDGEFYGSDLQELGEDGWEMTDIVALDRQTHVCYFKRPILIKHEETDERH